MKNKLLLISLFLTGCATVVPVTVKFPDAPSSLLEPCSSLKQTQNTDKMSDVLVIVVDNYTEYSKCSAKVDAWSNWYTQQKGIFNQ